MRHGSLFSGIGGFDLAARWMGWENVFQVEIDPYCQKVLEKNFPETKRYGDIKEFDGTKYRGAIDILTGGPPCQPTSLAGKRQGTKDDRWLWPETLRIFGEIKPRISVFENPDDLLTLEDGEPFERICLSMEAFGYKIETYGIPAACVGAWDERDRIWIIAYHDNVYDSGNLANRKSLSQSSSTETEDPRRREALDGKWLWIEPGTGYTTIPDFDGKRLSGATLPGKHRLPKKNGTFKGCTINGASTEIGAHWSIEPNVVRVVSRLSARMDKNRKRRIHGLGNAIKPQVAYEIFKAIEATMKQ